MFKKIKKIKFFATLPDFNIHEPAPASSKIPSWFRQMDQIKDGGPTIKKCVPFLDAMLSGYTITSAADVYFEDSGLTTNSHIPIVETHGKDQVYNFPIPEEYNDQPFKWLNHFVLRTPKGYSTLFLHPVNQIGLPFYSLGGIVDTDKYPATINFPFFIKKDFTGIIPANTPIIQAIPFKRDDWEMSLDEIKSNYLPIDFENSRVNPPFNYYKRKFWTRKRYS